MKLLGRFSSVALATLLLAASFTTLLVAPSVVAQPTVHVVNQSGFTFDPADITIPAGDTVHWVWSAGTHTVTNGLGSADPDAGTLFDAPLDAAHPTFDYTFTTPGDYDYFCRVHEALGMSGIVHVTPGPGEPLNWAGQNHTALGDASIAVDPEDHLIVSNIGSSGQDGVSIDLGETPETFQTSLPLDPGMPLDSYMVSNSFGDVNGVPDQPAGQLGLQSTADGLAAIVDFGPLGSPTYTLELRDLNGQVLVTQSGLSSGDVLLQSLTIKRIECKCNWDWLDSSWEWTIYLGAVSVRVNGLIYDAHDIIFRPDSPLVGPIQVHRVDMLAAGMPAFPILDEKLGVFGTLHHAEGDAHFAAAGGELTVSNIGSSGQDGVSADFGDESFTCVIWDIKDGEVPAPGSTAQYDIVGYLDGVAEQVCGNVLYTYTGSTVQLSADFSPAGATAQHVQVFDGPTLVAELSGQTGVLAEYPVTASVDGLDIAILVTEGPGICACNDKLSVSAPITLPDGTDVIGDHIIMTPEDPTVSVLALNGFSLRMQDTPPIVIHGEIITPIVTAVGGTEAPRPALSLDQVYPNPFNPQVKVSFSLSAPAPVTLDVYDVKGRLVRALLAGEPRPAGIQSVLWNGVDDKGNAAASGIYLFQMRSAGQVNTVKGTLVR